LLLAVVVAVLVTAGVVVVGALEQVQGFLFLVHIQLL
jgi:hypothetical protein